MHAGTNAGTEPTAALNHDDFDWARPRPAKVRARAAAKKSQAKPVREPVAASQESLPSEAAEPSLPALSQALPSEAEDAAPSEASVPVPTQAAKSKSPKSKATGKAKILKRPSGMVKQKPRANLPPPPAGHYRLHGRGGVQVILPLGESLGCPKCVHAAIGCARCRRLGGLVLEGLIWQRPAGQA